MEVLAIAIMIFGIGVVAFIAYTTAFRKHA